MNGTQATYNTVKRANRLLNVQLLLFLLCLVTTSAFGQTITTFAGVVKDASTKEPLPYAVVAFDNTTVAAYTSNSGQFSISNRRNLTKVTVSLMGYKSKSLTIPAEKTTFEEILLETSDQQLSEVIVKPKKEKYSKKNNPAVELINKVIANKDKNNVGALDYYQYKEYERYIFAFNEFNPESKYFKKYDFLSNYADTSIINDKPILPFSVKEKVTDIFYRKTPQTKKRIVKGNKSEGLDQALDKEGIDAFIQEAFQDVNIYDNYITTLMNNFVGPLSKHQATSFYKWYLGDTVQIKDNRYVRLDFAPFNSRDIGFTGNLYISLDSAYAVKKAILRAPKNINVNWVTDMVVHLDFEKDENGAWVPTESRMGMDLSIYGALKLYVDKVVSVDEFMPNLPISPVYSLPDPEMYEKDYNKRPPEFWVRNRPNAHQTDHKMGEMMGKLSNDLLFKLYFDLGNIVMTGYVPLNKDPEVNKFELGTIRTLYSYNPTEGNRFRLTGTTTKNFHKNLFLYGYGAYGTKDNKFKYMGEVSWSFNDIKYDKEEFPINNLSFTYKNDINSLGQRFTQAERDNILLSFRTSSNIKTTYNRQVTLKYHKEYHSGFAFKLQAQTNTERPARNLTFEKRDEAGNITQFSKIKNAEGTVVLRYAHNEKFMQKKRRRVPIPSERLILELTNTTAIKGFLGGQYDYNKLALYVDKDFWVTPYGKLNINAKAEKLWGKAHYSSLIAPSSNNSLTLQSGSFYLVEPLEFIHDEQISWEVFYHMGGWFFNKVPLINKLKLREVFGFRGFYGSLSNKNNPAFNRDQMLFPEGSFQTKGQPYMEYSLGIENILNVLRIDYIRRVNYLGNPDINRHGFRFTFQYEF